MKKILLAMLIILLSFGSAWSQLFVLDKDLAEKGYPEAQYSLGRMYFFGEEDQGVTQDYKQALYWFTKAAEQGHPEAQYSLGVMYAQGKGIPQDYKQAVYWYTKAAEQGEPQAQFNLGQRYSFGQGVPQDYKQAAKWYTKAAIQGLSLAQHNLGTLYKFGQGVPQDYKQALFWFTKAAEQGFEDAQLILGAMYGAGIAVPQNYKLSYVWFSLAASQGNKKAIEGRDLFAKRLSPQQMAEAQELAIKIQYQIDHPSDSTDSRPPIAKTERTISGSGTGFIITRDGFILTCHHVIKDANEVQIVVNGNTYPAKIIRDDPYNL